jgi:hypothetical protein
MKRRRSSDEDPFAVLGLSAGAGRNEVIEARRRLAKTLHPDVGGSQTEMQRINAAAQGALAQLELGSGAVAPGSAPHGAARRQTTEDPSARGAARRDHPSFTIEALPVEAFEGLLVVASWVGDLISDDPPYMLEIALVDPIRGWCRLDLVPDAGSSTVSLSVAAEPGFPVPDIDRVRDLWIDGLNRLDWAGIQDGDDRGVSAPLP